MQHACGAEMQSDLASHGNVSLQHNAHRLTMIALWHKNGTMVYNG